MSNQVKIKELDTLLKNLKLKTFQILEQTNNSEIKLRLEQELKRLEDRTDLKVAFVGQYNSGKSTIISALTGDKSIIVDANVATDEVSEYKWHNIILLDTPGILAGKIERHDEATKNALTECDLIVYVVTSQLFDDVIFENFIDLAYAQNFKDKMLIAINKMSMETGEFDELVENYSQSLTTIFAERDYVYDFKTIFIDAADYLDGKEENDDEFIKLSNFSTFISSLNQFVDEKGIIKKQFDTPVRMLKSGVSDIALASINPELQLLLQQAEQKIKNSKKDVERAVALCISNTVQEIKSLGYTLANKIGDVNDFDFKHSDGEFNYTVRQKVRELEENIQKIIQEEQEKLMAEIAEFTTKPSFEAYVTKLEEQLKTVQLPSEVKTNIEKQKQILGFLNARSNSVIGMTFKDAATNGLKNVSGSTMHEGVIGVAKFFGHKFKPWGAIKTANTIGKGAKLAGPIIAVMGIGLDIYMDRKEENQRKKIKEAKDQYYNHVVNFAASIEKDSLKNLSDYIKNSFDARLEELGQNKIELVITQNNNTRFSEAIKKLNDEYTEFIDLIDG